MKRSEVSEEMKAEAGRHVRERDYWLETFSGEWAKSTFPYDRPISPGAGSFQQLRFSLGKESYPALMRISSGSNHRLYMILLTQLLVLLYKYAGSTDITVGMPIFRQNREGKFINTVLALRNTFTPTVTFKELLLQVRQTVIDAVEHQNYPIETLIRKLNLTSGKDAFPLFDIAVLLEDIHDKNYLGSIRPKMIFSFRKLSDEVEGELEYNASLYTAPFIERIVKHYIHLVQGMMADLDLRLADVDILLEAERRQLLLDFNDTAADYPRHQTIHQLFEKQVDKTPDHAALVSREHRPGNTPRPVPGHVSFLTYQELNKRANRVAHMLRGTGVTPGTAVGLLMESSHERIVAILGILKAGAAYLPIDPGFPMQRISAVLEESDVALVLTDEEVLQRLPFTSLSNIVAGKTEAKRTPPREQITDFDALPFPDRTLIDYRKYHQYIGEAMAKHKMVMQTTRGCPYNCAFCHKIWPKKHVRRSADNIFQEIQYGYNAGIRRFALIDDIFNLDMASGSQLFRKILAHKIDLQLFFCNGLRADILTKDYIDLMVEAGTVNIDVALESGSPRIQKLIRKNLNLDRFYENVHYITQKHPNIILEMEIMLGFPTETEEEALMTLNLLKKLEWVHLPNLHVLKIYPTSDMARLAMENGIREELIQRSTHLAFHELPETLPFSKAFAREFQSRFMNEYFLLKERLIQVLPAQAKILSEDEMVDKYDSYLPVEIRSFQDILDFAGISREELADITLLPEGWMGVPDFNERIKVYFPGQKKTPDALKVLLLDVSQFFTSAKEMMIHNQNDEPLGLMYLLSYLNERFGTLVRGKIFKAGVDVDSYLELKNIILQFKPDLIGIRALSYYREFFHELVAYIRCLGVAVPIVSGGPYATSEYKFLLQDPQVDVVVLGEGELTFAELVEKMITNENKLPCGEVLKDIKGIAYVEKKDKARLFEKQREVIPLDRISAELVRYPVDNPPHVNQGQDLLYLISTSGSTGKPKTVMLEHRNLANLLAFQNRKTNIDFSSRALQFASIGFDVSAQEIFSSLLSGGELYLISGDTKADVQQLFDWIETNHINILFLPPSFLKLVFSEPEYTAIFPCSVKHIIAAGEQLVVPAAFKKFLREKQIYLHNHYGPTETHVVTTLTIDPAGEIAKLPAIGKPIANTRIYILDDNLKPTPIGVAGQLYIAGSSVGRGYLNNPESTAEKFNYMSYRTNESNIPRKLYNTGDLAHWLPDGSIEFKGRKDHQVQVRGFRVELGEIEKHLREIDFVREAVVIHRGNGMLAYVVAQQRGMESELRSILLDRLPDYMIPSHFIQVDRIPLTRSGKVDRQLLPDPVVTPAGEYEAPGDEVEKRLVEIWSEILEIEKNRISIDANFFELGGHSLKATLLISRIHKEFDIRTSLGEIFNQPTIRALASLVKASGKEVFVSIKSVEKREYYPLSSAQKRLYIQQQMRLEDISYNGSIFVILEGELDKVRMEGAFKKLIDRHETLRTSFVVFNGEPAQKIDDRVEFAIEYPGPDCRDEPMCLPSDVTEKIKNFVRPFDLSSAPLMRVGLLETGHQEHILMVDMHHIITDATSLAITADEFMMVYKGEELPPLRLQYRDFSEWQNRMLTSGEMERQEEYWLKQFAGEIADLRLPADFLRPYHRTGRGDVVYFEIDRDLTAEIRKLMSDTGVTLFVVLLTLCNILLAKYTGQEDIVVGTASEGRRHADLQPIIGMFVNTLAMRSHPGKERTFLELLEEVKEDSLKAQENQDYQFEELVRKLGAGGQANRNPLFDVAFKLINNRPAVSEIPGLRLKPYEQEEGLTCRFDLAISAVETEGMVRMGMVYSTDLFKRSTIEDMHWNFIEIVRQVLENWSIKLKDIKISFRLSAARQKLSQEETAFGI